MGRRLLSVVLMDRTLFSVLIEQIERSYAPLWTCKTASTLGYSDLLISPLKAGSLSFRSARIKWGYIT